MRKANCYLFVGMRSLLFSAFHFVPFITFPFSLTNQTSISIRTSASYHITYLHHEKFSLTVIISIKRHHIYGTVFPFHSPFISSRLKVTDASNLHQSRPRLVTQIPSLANIIITATKGLLGKGKWCGVERRRDGDESLRWLVLNRTIIIISG